MYNNSFIFIVNDETLGTHLQYGFCATGNPDAIEENGYKRPIAYEEFLNVDFQKKQHSLLADILNVRIGDTVFFYTTRKGFIGIYKVIQTAFFDDTEIQGHLSGRPYRILVEPVYELSNPVPEHHLFSTPERQRIFWLWYFNKMRQKARGCIPLDPDARDFLIELLIKHNGKPLNTGLQKLPYNRRMLREINSIKIPFEERTDKILSEHSLRALMIFSFQRQSNAVSHVFGTFDCLEWFANEIPINVAGKSIDMMLYHKTELKEFGVSGRFQYSVIELKRDKADIEEYEQIYSYADWVSDTLADGESYLIQPVLVAYRFDSDLLELLGHLKRMKPVFKPVRLIEYRYNETTGLRLTEIDY